MPGHDCVRNPCGKGRCGTHPSGNHGVGDERWIYAVTDGCFALSLHVASGIYPDTVPDHTRRSPHGLVIHLHAPDPVDADDVRSGADGEPCDLLERRRCFTTEGEHLLAASLFEHHGGSSYEQPESLWLALEELWDARSAEWSAAPKKVRCPTCEGRGLIDGS